jgi:hypothetical protein
MALIYSISCTVKDYAANETKLSITFSTFEQTAATTFTASPASGSTVKAGAPIVLTFDAAVASVNGANDTGNNWTITAQETLEITWTNTDGTTGGPVILTYIFAPNFELNLGICGISPCHQPPIVADEPITDAAGMANLTSAVTADCFNIDTQLFVENSLLRNAHEVN